MLSQPDGPFINVPKLNLAKYAQRQNLAKVKWRSLSYVLDSADNLLMYFFFICSHFLSTYFTKKTMFGT